MLNQICRKFSLVALTGFFLTSLSACASSYPPPPGAGIPEAARKLIAAKYSSVPDLQRAAEGFANNQVGQWRAARATGTYDDELARKAGNSLMCWTARLERTLNRPVTEKEIMEFVGALSSTKELFSASRTSDSLQSGHPLILSASEESSCHKSKIE